MLLAAAGVGSGRNWRPLRGCSGPAPTAAKIFAAGPQHVSRLKAPGLLVELLRLTEPRSGTQDLWTRDQKQSGVCIVRDEFQSLDFQISTPSNKRRDLRQKKFKLLFA